MLQYLHCSEADGEQLSRNMPLPEGREALFSEDDTAGLQQTPVLALWPLGGPLGGHLFDLQLHAGTTKSSK